MRTTVTLDADVAELLRRSMRERKSSFKEALNDAVRAALLPGGVAPRVDTPTFEMGEPLVPLDRAIQLVAELEDGETLRKLAARR
jgi:hypothetical protein